MDGRKQQEHVCQQVHLVCQINGKLVDMLHDTMVAIKRDDKLLPDEIFMNNICLKIHVTNMGAMGPLSPLMEYMKHCMGEFPSFLFVQYISYTLIIPCWSFKRGEVN